MICKSKATIAPFLLLTCGTAFAAQWVQIGSKSGNVREYVDESSVVSQGDRRTAWIRYTWRPHTRKSDDGTKFVSISMEMTDFSCSSKQARTLSYSLTFEDGSGATSSAATDWVPVPPDTGWDVAMNYLCPAK
jgi:hypothetical protein